MRKYTFTIWSILILSLSLSGNGSMKNKFEIATFGGGCFWCVEAVFERVSGVHQAESGYSGGNVRNPDYKMVTSGTTGHAEVVQITFDPEVISYLELLEIFFRTHDPTTLNQQGADVGTQYRSIVLYHNEAQRMLALEIIEELDSEEVWSNPIVTAIEAFEQFYSAEAYHQEYYENNPNQGYCRLVITPKLEKFEKIFKEKLK
ncbi:MAG: peptide-methionine (S)-S-oxide reductase MsrA [Bacteroidetes bacterium]|nr:peptide-methionine (S)-S-oxide reductase MsrA [Bacteroidota bacterium]